MTEIRPYILQIHKLHESAIELELTASASSSHLKKLRDAVQIAASVWVDDVIAQLARNAAPKTPSIEIVRTHLAQAQTLCKFLNVKPILALIEDTFSMVEHYSQYRPTLQALQGKDKEEAIRYVSFVLDMPRMVHSS